MTSQQKLPVLYGGPTSPFARMAKLYGDLLGVAFTYEQINVYESEFLDAHNPLRQIPTLVLDADNALFDSRTIFAFFEQSAGLQRDDANFRKATIIALALGMTDACLQYRMETLEPEEQRNEAKLEKLKARMDRAVQRLERDAGEIISGETDLEQIVLACALEYLDFRYTQNWRTQCTNLGKWLREFSERADMIATRPQG